MRERQSLLSLAIPLFFPNISISMSSFKRKKKQIKIGNKCGKRQHGSNKIIPYAGIYNVKLKTGYWTVVVERVPCIQCVKALEIRFWSKGNCFIS